MKNSQRPVFLNVLKIRLPVTAIVSIFHRFSGAILAAIFPFAIFGLHYALLGEEHFLTVMVWFHQSLVFRGTALLGLLAYIYHAAAGLRHMIMDCGWGLTRYRATGSAYILLVGYLFVAIKIIGAILWA